MPLVWATLAILQSVDRHYDESIASAQKAVALGPGDAEAYITLGYVQMYAGNFAEAAAAIETALKLDPKLSPINRQIAGDVFFFSGDNDRAIATLEQARDEAPEVDDTLISLASAYARGGRIAEAKAAIEQAIRLPSSDPSLAGLQIRAHFRNETDFAFMFDALRQAGLPDWPFGFHEQGHQRLKGDEISRLVFGRTLQGFIDPGERHAMMQVATDGAAAFRSTTSYNSGTLFVDHDLLCAQSENGFGRPDCGPVLASTDNLPFVYVNSSVVFHFAPID